MPMPRAARVAGSGTGSCGAEALVNRQDGGVTMESATARTIRGLPLVFWIFDQTLLEDLAQPLLLRAVLLTI